MEEGILMNKPSARREQLLEIVGDRPELLPLVDDVVFLEKHLEYLRTLPQIRVDGLNPNHQKPTPASKQYKEFLQQYINALKVLIKETGQTETEEESPLKQWMNEHIK